MTQKIPFAGHKRSELKPYDGKRHSLTTIELAFRVRCTTLDELNEAYLADQMSTNFAEFMRKIVNLGMEVGSTSEGIFGGVEAEGFRSGGVIGASHSIINIQGGVDEHGFEYSERTKVPEGVKQTSKLRMLRLEAREGLLSEGDFAGLLVVGEGEAELIEEGLALLGG